MWPHLSILPSHTIVLFSKNTQTERKLPERHLKIEELSGCDPLRMLCVVSATAEVHRGSSEAARVEVTLGQMAELVLVPVMQQGREL